MSISVFGQTNSVQIQIDSIKTNNSNPKERQFTINYHIDNLLDNSISFYFNPKKIIPNAVASMSLQTIYKIYQNNNFIDVDGVFENYQDPLEEKNNSLIDPHYHDRIIEKSGLTKSKLDSILKNSIKNKEKSFNDLKVRNSTKIKDLKISFNPKETKNFSVICNWNKKRYSKSGENEYYLDEKSDYFIEFMLVLSKEKLKNRLSIEEFEKFIKDKNNIEGVFTSNRIKIDFRD